LWLPLLYTDGALEARFLPFFFAAREGTACILRAMKLVAHVAMLARVLADCRGTYPTRSTAFSVVVGYQVLGRLGCSSLNYPLCL
jgi:hypothetical protein